MASGLTKIFVFFPEGRTPFKPSTENEPMILVYWGGSERESHESADGVQRAHP